MKLSETSSALLEDLQRRYASLPSIGEAASGLVATGDKLPVEETEDDRISVARRLNAGSAVLSLSVLADSAVEHYRGSFANKAMFTPLVMASLTLANSLHGVRDLTPAKERRRDLVFAAAAATGLVGTGFHFYNVGKRTGGFSFQNLFYGAPLGAPMAILLAGLLGVSAERVRDTPIGRKALLFGLPAGRALAAVTSVGLFGTMGEAGLLHLRGAYHNPFMYLPVTMPPVAASLLAAAAVKPTRGRRWLARIWLWITALMGVAGMGFHAYGISRNMGGWRNWSQNVLNGPPLPAPPSFSGLAVAGLATLKLLGRRP